MVIDAASAEVVEGQLGKGWASSTVWSPGGEQLLFGVVGRTLRTWRVPADGDGASTVIADSVASSWQPCPDGECATFGSPRSKSRLALSIGVRPAAIALRGTIRPRTSESDSRRETVEVTLRVRRGGEWAKVQEKQPRTGFGSNVFETSLRHPAGTSCRVEVRYGGGWTRTPSTLTRTFAC
jgi:hypothetical protein